MEACNESEGVLRTKNFIAQESTNKGVNQLAKYETQVQQQRPESPTLTLTWHACKYKVHKTPPEVQSAN